jgi:ABC-type histidine transport system ATPase subunit
MSRPLPKPLAAIAAAAALGFLHEGRIIELGPPDQVLVDPERPETKRFLRRLLEAGRI